MSPERSASTCACWAWKPVTHRLGARQMPSDAELETALVFDFGLTHIGVAVAQRPVGLARALATIPAQDGSPRWAALDSVIAEWRPKTLVIGLPLNMDGTSSAMAERARDFGGGLAARYGLAVEYVDERLSTFEATTRFAKRPVGRRKRASGNAKQSSMRETRPSRSSAEGSSLGREDARIHAVAAEVIAETWLRH